MNDLNHEIIKSALEQDEIKALIAEGNLQKVYTEYFTSVWTSTIALTEYLLDLGVDILEYLTDTVPINCFTATTWRDPHVEIPSHIKKIDAAAFDDNLRIQTVTFAPQSTETIGSYAFSNCEELYKVTLPATVKIIAEEAFAGCDKLKKVIYPLTVDELKLVEIDETAFYRTPLRYIQCKDGKSEV